jgi:hypothetical protein
MAEEAIDISGTNPMIKGREYRPPQPITRVTSIIQEQTENQQTTIHAFAWANPEEHCLFLEEKIDVDLGFYYTKKYIAAAFWSQISMPINLALTFITALTTAQANTTGMLPEHIYSTISIAALILSVLNTFFRPHVQMSKNAELMRDCSKIASDFEKIYYSNDSTESCITSYQGIQSKIYELRNKEGADTINFFTDFIHFVARNCCFRSKQKWLDMNRTIMEASRARHSQGRCSNGDCCVPVCSQPTVAELNSRHPLTPPNR